MTRPACPPTSAPFRGADRILSDDQESDLRVEALSTLHDDLKETARHHETISITIIAAQIAVMAGVASVWGSASADPDLKVSVSVGHVLCNLVAVLLLYAHFSGRRAHIAVAQVVRPELCKLIGTKEIGKAYETQFGNSQTRPTYVAILGMAYDWLPLCFGGLILAASSVFACSTGWEAALGAIASALVIAFFAWSVLEVTKKKRDAQAKTQGTAP